MATVDIRTRQSRHALILSIFTSITGKILNNTVHSMTEEQSIHVMLQMYR